MDNHLRKAGNRFYTVNVFPKKHTQTSYGCGMF